MTLLIAWVWRPIERKPALDHTRNRSRRNCGPTGCVAGPGTIPSRPVEVGGYDGGRVVSTMVSLTTEVGVAVSWKSGWTLDAGQRAALEGGKTLVCVAPPAGWALVSLFERLAPIGDAGIETLVLVPETPDGLDLAAAIRPLPSAHPVHVVTGLARSAQLLRRTPPRTLVATPADALHLIRQSCFPGPQVRRALVAWPESQIASGQSDALEQVLSECSGAQRLVATADDRAIADFLERHARRAPVAAWSRLPGQPAGAARYAVVDDQRRAAAVRSALDTLNPGSALLWDPSPVRRNRWLEEYAGIAGVTVSDEPPEPGQTVDLVVAVDLPPREAFEALADGGATVIVLVRAAQLSYLQRLIRGLTAQRLPGPTDLARQQIQQLRQQIRERIDQHDCTGDLLALEPLFDEFDPALVAAALLVARPAGEEPSDTGLAAWVRLHVNVGQKDRVRPADLLGALINGVGISKDHVGRIDIREGFSLVEIGAEDAVRAVQGLTGMSLRGRRLTARPDRR